ncbi:MAG: DNA polymerase domain-containing protein [Promethearchaeota archaeon]
MPTPKKSKKKTKVDDNQKSLFSFMDEAKSPIKKTKEPVLEEHQEVKKKEENIKTEEPVSERENEELEKPVTIKKAKKKYFEKRAQDFGLKEFDVTLDSYKESASSKYIRYLIETDKIVKNLKKGLLLDVDYDGGQNKAVCKFYDLDTDEIRLWIDTTGHEPYCLSKESIKTLETIADLTSYSGFKRFEEVKRIDLLTDREIVITKIIGATPSDIGGSGTNIKNILSNEDYKAWEADLRYHLNYIFDTQLIPGLIYSIDNGKLNRISYEEDNDDLKKLAGQLRDIFIEEKEELQEFAEKYLDIFLTPIPDVKRLAMDIEVSIDENAFGIPNPREAKQEVISVSFVSTDGLKLVYVLEREGFIFDKVHEDFPEEAQIFFFKKEKDLIIETFRLFWEYPVIITFNGDNFDLNYLFHRANKLRINKDLNPIQIKRGFGIMAGSECNLRRGIHLDLFGFFFNRSISGYAFGGAYTSNSLNAISAALLGQEKYQHEEEIHEMEYDILTWYNLKDSILTLDLTRFNNSLVWNLIILLCRMTKMPIHETVRRQISTWIQNIFYFEHRRKGYLIPRRKEISEMRKGGYSKSVIEGKSFQGAYVIPPVPGIHYNVVVMDFSSLYPSIIKEYNLSYETVSCIHKDCEDNFVKGIPYHICTHKMGIFAYVVGFFRDIRVKFFKPVSGDKSLSQKQRDYYKTIQQALKVFINGCLPYNEEVIIKNENDEIQKVKIGDLEKNWENKKILSIERDVNHFGKSIFVDIVGVVRRKADEYIKITLSDGRRIQCTKEHIIPKIKELDQIIQVEAGSLKIGDNLLVSHKNYLNENPPSKIFIPNLIHSKNLWVSLERDEYKKYSYRTSESTTSSIINLINTKFCYSKVSRVYKCLWDNLEQDEKKLIESKSSQYNFLAKYGEEAGKWHQITLSLTSEFFALLGWYIAEGSVDRNRITITQKRDIHPSRYEHIISLITLLKFPCSYDNKKHIRINSNILKEVISSLCSSGAGNKKIPLELLDTDRALILLDNYYLGDGNLKKGKWKRYSTKSEQLKNDLVYLLGSLGEYCSIVNPTNSNNIFRIINTEGRKYRRKFYGLVNFNGTTPVRIKNIESYHKEIDVFDIETGNGWFVTTNGVIVHNCYGVFGSQNFPLFCLPVAESTTGIGQYSIKQTILKAEELGVKVLYGDTDSVFLLNPSQSQMKEITDWSKNELDLDLEEEKTYQFLALSNRKKNYIGIYKDTKSVDIKGLVAKKKNTPNFIKKVFNELIEILKKIDDDESFSKARDIIIKIVRSNLKKIGKPDTFTLEDYAINIALKKPLNKYIKGVPQHVRAARDLIQFKINEVDSKDKDAIDAIRKTYRKGDTVKFIKIKGPSGAKAIEIAKLHEVDIKKYKELLQSALEQVLDALGITFEEVKGIKKMDAFF